MIKLLQKELKRHQSIKLSKLFFSIFRKYFSLALVSPRRAVMLSHILSKLLNADGVTYFARKGTAKIIVVRADNVWSIPMTIAAQKNIVQTYQKQKSLARLQVAKEQTRLFFDVPMRLVRIGDVRMSVVKRLQQPQQINIKYILQQLEEDNADRVVLSDSFIKKALGESFFSYLIMVMANKACFSPIVTSKGIVHGDLHEGNVYINHGHYKLLDLDKSDTFGYQLYDKIHATVIWHEQFKNEDLFKFINKKNLDLFDRNQIFFYLILRMGKERACGGRHSFSFCVRMIYKVIELGWFLEKAR